MKTKYKIVTVHGYQYILDLEKEKFIVKDNGRDILKIDTVAHKFDLFRNNVDNITFDLNNVINCLPKIHEKSIKKIIEEVKGEMK